MEITPFKGVMTVKPTNQPTDQPTGGNEGSKGRYTSNKSWIQKVFNVMTWKVLRITSLNNQIGINFFNHFRD